MQCTVELNNDEPDFLIVFGCFINGGRNQVVIDYVWNGGLSASKEEMEKLVNGEDVELNGVEVENGSITFRSGGNSGETWRGFPGEMTLSFPHEEFAHGLRAVYEELKAKGDFIN